MSATAIQNRIDDWTSRLLGFGSTDDSLARVYMQRNPQPVPEQLDAIHARDTLAQIIVGQIVNDSLREGFTFEHENSELAEATREWMEEELNLTQLLTDAGIKARLMGTCLVHPLVEDGSETDMPMRLPAVQRLLDVRLYDRGELTVQAAYRSFESKDYGKPELYHVQPTPRTMATATPFTLHASRAYAVDAPVDTERTRNLNAGFPESVLTPILPKLKVYNVAGAALGHLVSKQGTPKYGLKNLSTLLEGSEKKLRDRFALMEQLRSTMNAVLLDADMETLELMASPMQGLSDVFDRIMQILSQESRVPMTKLFGRSPAGQNATGESDMRNWYDEVSQYRRNTMTPLIMWLARLAARDERCPAYGKGFKPSIVWPSLWQATTLEAAEGANKTAQTDAIYMQAGVYTPEDVAVVRSQPQGWTKPIPVSEDVDLEKYLKPVAAAAPALPGADVQKAALDVAQVTALQGIVESAAAGRIPVESAKWAIVTSFPITEERADQILASIGQGFQLPSEGGTETDTSGSEGGSTPPPTPAQ